MKTPMIFDSVIFEPVAAGVALPMLLLALVLSAAPASGQMAVPVPEAVRKACESLTRADFQKYNRDKAYVRKIQRGLEKTFGDSIGPQGQDGIIGVNTTAGLKKFCIQSTLRPARLHRSMNAFSSSVVRRWQSSMKFNRDTRRGRPFRTLAVARSTSRSGS